MYCGIFWGVILTKVLIFVNFIEDILYIVEWCYRGYIYGSMKMGKVQEREMVVQFTGIVYGVSKGDAQRKVNIYGAALPLRKKRSGH